jgi:uncharacterized pyridoxal phosphate-dependent enzyme
MKRREAIRKLSVIPFAGAAIGSLLPLNSCGTGTSARKRDLFKELGVTPVINCRGTVTVLSGSLMLPEVMEAINQTSNDFVDMYELRDKAGERIAEMLECEAAMVTSGAAAAITLGTAASITGTDQERVRLLPNIPGPQLEVIIQNTHRVGYDHAIRNCGVKLVEVDGPAEMEKAINEKTVMAFFYNAARSHSVSHEDFIAICRRHNIPSFNDAAADVPPVENLFKYQRMGFDLVTFSGGKMIHGPQSAGLLFGRRDLIEAAKLNHSPNGNTIGRGMKVNKEEIFGMYAALKAYLEKDHEKEWQEWLGRIRYIGDHLAGIPTLKTETILPAGVANAFPSMNISWDQNRVRITPQEAVEALRNGTPCIHAGSRNDALSLAVVLLRPEWVDTVARRVESILTQAVSG